VGPGPKFVEPILGLKPGSNPACSYKAKTSIICYHILCSSLEISFHFLRMTMKATSTCRMGVATLYPVFNQGGRKLKRF